MAGETAPPAQTAPPAETAPPAQTDPEANLDEAVKEVLAKERKAARDALRRATAAESRAKELEDAGKSAEDKATEAATSAVKRAEAAELKVLRLEIAAEKGLKPQAFKLLGGSTREEIEELAAELVKLTGSASAGSGKDPDQGRQDGGAGGNGAPATDMNAWMRKAVGRAS